MQVLHLASFTQFPTGKLVPLVIELMMEHPGTLWGDACYPVVD